MRDLKDFGFILFIIVLVVAGLQWVLLRFTHWAVALIVTGIIGLFISSFYVALAHARPNGGSSGPPSSAYIAPTLLVVTSLLLGLWLVSYLSKSHLPKLAIIVLLCLMFSFAIVRHVYEYVHIVTYIFTNFSTCEIELLDESEGKSNVEEILFRNSTSGFFSSILIKPRVSPNPEMVRFADTLEFRNYSAQKAFVQKFPFDYSLFKEKAGPIEYVFWLRSHSTLPMKIVLLPNDIVDLYLGGKLVKQYQVNKDVK